jgi:hypothetical protein
MAVIPTAYVAGPSTGAAREFVYRLENRSNGVSEIVAVNEHESRSAISSKRAAISLLERVISTLRV